MLKVTTESGSMILVDLNNRRFQRIGTKLSDNAFGTPYHETTFLENEYDTLNTPVEVGKRLYIEYDHVKWYTSTPVAEIEQVV